MPGDVLLMDNPPKDEAISVCIEAATKEFDILTQKHPLRAASYGMQLLKQRQASNSAAAAVSSRLVACGPLELADGELLPSEDSYGGTTVVKRCYCHCTHLVNLWLPHVKCRAKSTSGLYFYWMMMMTATAEITTQTPNSGWMWP
jgi:hypothetical protein